MGGERRSLYCEKKKRLLSSAVTEEKKAMIVFNLIEL